MSQLKREYKRQPPQSWSCSFCGKREMRSARRRRKKFCSHSCYSDSRRGVPLTRCSQKCQKCRKSFFPKQNWIFCSRDCYMQSLRDKKGETRVERVKRNCSHCGSQFECKWWRPKKYCNHFCYSQSSRGKPHKMSAETRKRLSEANKKAGVFKRLWKDPEFRKKRINGLHAAPNYPETVLMDILQSMYPREYKFTGDGSFLVDGLNPDYANVNGQKKLIELFGESFHDPKVSLKPVPYRATEKGRRKAFKKYGYSLLVIWCKELKSKRKGAKERLMKKIARFHEA